MAIAGVGTGFTGLDDELGAESVVLDLVNPTFSLGRLINEGSELGFDEAELTVYAGHGQACS